MSLKQKIQKWLGIIPREDIEEMREKLDFICKKLGYYKEPEPKEDSFFASIFKPMFTDYQFLKHWDKLIEYLGIEWEEKEIKKAGYKKIK